MYSSTNTSGYSFVTQIRSQMFPSGPLTAAGPALSYARTILMSVTIVVIALFVLKRYINGRIGQLCLAFLCLIIYLWKLSMVITGSSSTFIFIAVWKHFHCMKIPKWMVPFYSLTPAFLLREVVLLCIFLNIFCCRHLCIYIAVGHAPKSGTAGSLRVLDSALVGNRQTTFQTTPNNM